MAKAKTPQRRSTFPAVAAALHPVTKRLARMEAILVEMRFEQDVKLKRLSALEAQIDGVAERLERGRGNTRRSSEHGQRRTRARPLLPLGR